MRTTANTAGITRFILVFLLALAAGSARAEPSEPTPTAMSDLSGESSSTTSEILATGDYDLVPGPRARYSDEDLEALGLCPEEDEVCEPPKSDLRISDDPSPDGSGTR